MMLHHLHHWQKKNSEYSEFFGDFSRENRESFRDANSSYSFASNVKDKTPEFLTEKEKKKQALEIRDTNRERIQIQKILKKIDSPLDITEENQSESKIFYSKSPELVSVLLKEKNMSSAVRKEILETLKEDPEKERQEISGFFFRVKSNGSITSKEKNLVMKISPEKFLNQYVGNDEVKRGSYFRVLSLLDADKISTLTFTKKCNTEKFSQFLTRLNTEEEKAFLEIFIQTNKFHSAESNNLAQLKNNKMKTDIISFARDESIKALSQTAKEEKLIEKVRKDISLGNTGEKTAQKIEKELEKDEHKSKSEIERQKIFFRIVREASAKYLKSLSEKGTVEILDTIEYSRKFYVGLFSLSGLSDEEKMKDIREIEKVYDMFTQFFSGKKNGDVARFYLEHKGLTAEEVREIDAIENKKAEIEGTLLTLGTEYSDRTTEIYNLEKGRSTAEYKVLAKKHKVDVKYLRKSVEDGDVLEPSHFIDFSSSLSRFGFTSNHKIDALIHSPSELGESIDKKVLIQWTKKEGIAGFFKIASPRVIEFYSSSHHRKKQKMLTRFSNFEEVMADDLVNNRKLSTITVAEELRDEFKKKTSPEYIQEKLQQSQDELESIRLLLNENGYNYTQKEFPVFSDAEIKAESQKFSADLVQIMRDNAQKENPLSREEIESVILDELYSLEIDGKLEKLQNVKQEILMHIEDGDLKSYISGKETEDGSGELKLITNSLSSRRGEKPTVSPAEKNFADFIKKFTPLSNKFSSGSFTVDDLPALLNVRNTNGESLIIPLSRTDKPIENFESESDEGVVFDPQSGHIIVSDELYRDIQKFPESKHVRLLSHEIGHLWANKSNLEKNARKLLKRNNLLEYTEKEFLEIFPHKTGVKNNVHPVEEVFSELVSASQFGLENYSDSNFFQNTLGLGERMSKLLKLIIGRVGLDNIKNIISNGEKEFLDNIKVDKEKVSVGKEGHGASTTEAEKKELDAAAKEDCETNYGSASDNNTEGGEKSPPVNPKKLLRMQADAKIKEANTKALFSDIKKYKSALPQYSSDIDSFLEKHEQFLQEDIEDIGGNNLSEAGAKGIMDHIDKINTNARGFSGQLAEQLNPDTNYFESLWSGTRFLSLKDLGKMWDTAYESIKRRLDRNAKARIGEAGNSMFSGVWDGLANEFDKDVQNAEKEEVGDIQSALENKQTDDVYAYLENASNKDEVKAALQHLSSGGMIDWNKKEVTGALSRLGSGVPFYKSDFDNPDIRNKKLKKAFTRVWGEEEMFNKLFNENDGNISGNIDKYKKEASTNVGMTDNIRAMMNDHQKGVFVDPNRYEGYVKQMAEDAKGSPGEPFFWMVYGVAHKLIPIQSFNRFDLGQNNYSISNFLSDGNWTVEDAQKWCKEIMWNSNKNDYVKPQDVTPTSIDHWLYKNVFTNSSVFERTNTNVSQRNFDHDHGRLFYSVGSSESALGFLATDSTGTPKIKQTAYTNATAGMMEHITSLAIQEEDFDKDVLRHTVARQAGFFAAFDGVSSGKMNTKAKHKYMFSPANYDEKPREGGAYNKNMTTRDYIDAQRDIYSSVESQELQTFLEKVAFNKDLVTSDDAKRQEVLKEFKEEGKYLQIKEAMSLSGLNLNLEKEGTNLFEAMIPALFSYFLNPPAGAKHITQGEADKNLNSILAKTRNISSGNCNPDWANIGGDSSVKDSKLSTPPEKSNINSADFSKNFDSIFGGHNS